MPDYNSIFQSLLILQEETYPNAFDEADTLLLKQLNTAFWVITRDRDTRLKLMGEVVGRTLKSTYDLTVGEAHALLKLCDQNTFIAAMKGEAQ